MKDSARKLFSFILDYFESGQGEYRYKKTHRTILIAVGSLFLILSLLLVAVALGASTMGAVLPCVIFFSVGVTCLVVGTLGSDRAVAKIWGNR